MLFGRVYPISVFLLIHLSWQYKRIPLKANPVLGIPHLSPLHQAKACSQHCFSFSAWRPGGWFSWQSRMLQPLKAQHCCGMVLVRWNNPEVVAACSISSDSTSFIKQTWLRMDFAALKIIIKYQSNQYKNFLVQFLTRKTAQDLNFPKTKISLCICQ